MASGPSFDPGTFNFGTKALNSTAITAYNSTTNIGGPSSTAALGLNPVTNQYYVPAAKSGGTGPGFGGVADQCAYCGAPDSMWVLELNMATGVSFNGYSYVSGNLAPGVTIASPAGTWPYDPAGGAVFYATPSNKSALLVTTQASPVTAPPPPMLDAPLPAAITLPTGCLTVEQFLCKYTVGNLPNPNTTTASVVGSVTYTSTGADSICGVFFFGTGTGASAATRRPGSLCPCVLTHLPARSSHRERVHPGPVCAVQQRLDQRQQLGCVKHTRMLTAAC